MWDLVFHRGLLSGRHHALKLLQPGSFEPRPRCPYWCPVRVVVWKAAFSIGTAEVLYRR